MKKSTAAWREIGGKRIYARSIWEANYARYLQWLQERNEIIAWEHEPKTFWFEGIKRGVCSYKPDYFVQDEKGGYYVEVKGYWDSKSLTKIKRFKKYFPNEKITCIDSAWFAKNNAKLAMIIKSWERG